MPIFSSFVRKRGIAPNIISTFAVIIQKNQQSVSDFPKWLLALAFVSLIPLLACPLYLFGGMPFGTSESAVVRFFLYLTTQMLWFIPIVLFFAGLDAWRRGYYKTSLGVIIASDIIGIAGLVALFV